MFKYHFHFPPAQKTIFQFCTICSAVNFIIYIILIIFHCIKLPDLCNCKILVFPQLCLFRKIPKIQAPATIFYTTTFCTVQSAWKFITWNWKISKVLKNSFHKLNFLCRHFKIPLGHIPLFFARRISILN